MNDTAFQNVGKSWMAGEVYLRLHDILDRSIRLNFKQDYLLSAAQRKSSIKSSTSSSPTESRISSSVIPRPRRSLAGIAACDISFGYERIDSTPPRLTATFQILTRFMIR